MCATDLPRVAACRRRRRRDVDVDVDVERKQAQADSLFARLNNTITMPTLMKI